MPATAPPIVGLVSKTNVLPDDETPGSREFIKIKVTHPKDGQVAKITAVKIFRHRCMHDFLTIMDADSSELHAFSVALFDKHIQPRPWLIDGGRRSGTGCWGEEMNRGDVLYIIKLEVQASHRRKGVGTWMLQQFLSSASVKTNDIVYCWPTPEFRMMTPEARTADVNRQLAFYRKNGFRRVGRTDFLGYSPDPNHRSRLVPASSDAASVSEDFALEENSARDVQAPPLHVSISEVKTPAIERVIDSFYDADPRSIHQPDAYGFTPVHRSMANLNIYALCKLIDLGVTEDLRNCHNIESVTPQDLLYERMRSTREFCETMMGTWNGYEKTEIRAEYCAKRALGEIEDSVSEPAFEAQRKWGCTCGACLGGFMSPRMCFRLRNQAALIMDMMGQNMDMFKRGQPLQDADELFDNGSDYLPQHLRSSMYKTFYKGYQTLFATIYAMTRLPTLVTVATLASAAAGHSEVSFYVSKGGRYEYALDAVTSVAREQSCLGDGTFEETYEDEAEVGTEYTGLPKCANDLEFELVRRLMGLDPDKDWGPHYGSDDDDFDMDVDGIPPVVQEIIDSLRRVRGQEVF